MGERKGWFLVWLGAAAIVAVCLGVSLLAFYGTSALLEGILQ